MFMFVNFPCSHAFSNSAINVPTTCVYDQDVGSEITAELQGFPDFIIGNYSDGNLVASLLAYKMGITQVNYDFSTFWFEM